MWGITTYFNPVKGRGSLRYDNYRIFRDTTRKQKLKLCVVELVYDDVDGADGEAELKNEIDGDIVIHVRTTRARGVLWQKERMLNIALKALPRDCHYICWIDADLIFESSDWVQRVEYALSPDGEDCSIVQPFSVVCMLPKDWKNSEEILQDTLSMAPHRFKPSSMFTKLYWKYQDTHTPEHTKQAEREQISKEGFSLYPAIDRYKDIVLQNIHSGGKVGLCWAAKRQLIEACGGFYDCNIIGSGDAVIYAATNVVSFDADSYSDFHKESVLRYLEKAHSVFGETQVGCIDGLILHMWHGKIKNRRYGIRNKILQKHNYNPNLHIKINQDGVWEWRDIAPKELIDEIRTYFEKRKEQ